MKKPSAAVFIVTVLTLILLPFLSSAQEESHPIEGVMIGGTVSQVAGEMSFGSAVRYWGEMFGAEVGLNFGLINADIAGTEIVDQSDFAFTFGPLAGYQVWDRTKLFFKLGFTYQMANENVSDLKLTAFSLDPSVGIDFLAAEHVVIGIGIFSSTFLLTGKAKSGGVSLDLGGHAFAIMNSFSVSYLF